MKSKLSFLLPNIFQGNEELEAFLQGIEGPLFELQEILQKYTRQLLPEQAPKEWFRWLFYLLGGEEYYRDDYDEAEKRKVLRSLFKLYTLKGTPEGIREHLRVLAGNPVYVHNAPDKHFLSPALSDEEREHFESRFREVRIFPYLSRGKASLWSVFIDRFASGFLIESDAFLRLHGRITLYDPLTDKEEVITAFHPVWGSEVEIRKPGRAYGIFVGSFLRGFLYYQEASARLYRVVLSGVADDTNTFRTSLGLRPSLYATSVRYRERYLSGHLHGMCPLKGKAMMWRFPVESTAAYRVMRYFRIFEEERAVLSKRFVSYFVGALLGSLPPYHVEVGMYLPKKISPFVAGGFGYLLRRFLVPSDASYRVERARWATNLARAAGVKVTLDCATSRMLRCGEGIKVGNYLCGTHTIGGVLK